MSPDIITVCGYKVYLILKDRVFVTEKGNWLIVELEKQTHLVM
jgi:hypothetical protein